MAKHKGEGLKLFQGNLVEVLGSGKKSGTTAVRFVHSGYETSVATEGLSNPAEPKSTKPIKENEG